ncbi:PREDICTED: uncharacterized protein LOC109179165 [Ipomoea nil]|uniref:uncharacterized protein LOC109179165 n=1 Tax=Ipomoea nil TaxID=35883 RepID=UPI0009014FC7|nr:PREDICTED: uncharacterized protein LOC109179165 [Ipomoea nil]
MASAAIRRLKLNTDALFLPEGAAGGACVRDHRDYMVAGLSFNLSASSALEAEALALHFALQWCDTMVMILALVEVDSFALVHLASSSSTTTPWKFRDAILCARACLSSWGSSIRHVFREANQVADALATVGLNTRSASIYCSISSLLVSVKLALLYDLRGFATHRAISLK